MGSTDIKEFILDLIGEKLAVFNIKRGEVNNDFDLVKSGLLDSMSFIDLVAELEDKYKLEVDFEEAADNNDFTTMGGLIQLITDTKNA
jgi:acyl carrier protein